MRRLAQVLMFVCALLLFTAAVPEARAAEPGENVIRYIPEADWQTPGLSEAEKEARAHTVHWLTGVRPPLMPHEVDAPAGRTEESVGRFTFLEEGGTNAYYAAPYTPGNGWYDVNKYVSEGGDTRDSRLCFALAATNLLHWWLEQNSDYIGPYLAGLDDPAAQAALTRYVRNTDSEGRPRPVLQHASTSTLYNEVIYPAYESGPGGHSDKPIDYFINGYPPTRDMGRNRPDRFPAEPAAGGGLFHEVFGRSILSDYITNGHFSELERELGPWMDRGTGVVIGFNIFGGAHAVTLWGAEYDENGTLCALYMVDNNDNGEQVGTFLDGRLAAMVRYEVFKSPDGPAAYITTRLDRKGTNTISSGYALDLGRGGWEHWKTHGEPLYADGRAFLHPIMDLVHCEHTYAYSARGAQLVRSCPKCGDTMYIYMDLSVHTGRVYTGGRIRPVVKKSSRGTEYPFTTSEIRYENNRDAGTATAYMSTTQDGVTYTAQLDFEILPQPEQIPAAGPVLAEKTAYSVTLEALPGLEYSLDGTVWQSGGRFDGLQPETAYTFRVRTAPRDSTGNYAPSAPCGETLTVTTAREDPAEAPAWTIRSIGGGQVTAVNSGRYDTVTLIVAGYDDGGRQTYVHTQQLSSGGGQPVTAAYADGSAVHRAFLVSGGWVPAAQSKAAQGGAPAA